MLLGSVCSMMVGSVADASIGCSVGNSVILQQFDIQCITKYSHCRRVHGMQCRQHYGQLARLKVLYMVTHRGSCAGMSSASAWQDRQKGLCRTQAAGMEFKREPYEQPGKCQQKAPCRIWAAAGVEESPSGELAAAAAAMASRRFCRSWCPSDHFCLTRRQM